MSDYERVAAVIRYLDAHLEEQPDLKTLAGVVGLSPHHFHRLFTQWAQVTPKDFLQCLTLEHAREKLQAGESVLHAALHTGLSGPGRLHDLCLNLEAATPGDIKRGGDGWTITYGFAETPFGRALFAEAPRGLCHLSFVDTDKVEALTALRADWPQAVFERADPCAETWAQQVFVPRTAKTAQPLRAYVRGTAFQVQVWRALLAIPAGHLVTYGRLAEALGKPSAARAVGTAVGRNHLAYLIPCHRVIRETGLLGGYRWGLTRKQAMIGVEGAR